MCNILCLIISDDSLPIYKNNKNIWLTYMNRFENIKCYFIEFSNDETKTYPFIENNTCYLKGKESYSNILLKTLNSIEYFINSDNHYDFVLRTNLSTVVNFNRLEQYLQPLEPVNIYSGQDGPYYNIVDWHFMFKFIGGYGIIMSNDVCKLLIKNRNIAESFKNMDDIDIGYTMHTLNIPIKLLECCTINNPTDFEVKKNNGNHDFVIYRVKQSDDRTTEHIIMQNIVNSIYH